MTEVTEVSEVTVVETLWRLSLLLSVSVEADDGGRLPQQTGRDI